LLPFLFVVLLCLFVVSKVTQIIAKGKIDKNDTASKQLGYTHPPETDLRPPEQENSEESAMPKAIAGVVGTIQVLIPLAGVVDVDALRAKLDKNLSKVEAEAKSLSGRLGNANFVEKAAPDVVQKARDSLAEAEKQAEILRERLERL
jgi:valyl-tRNA synthetase